MTKLLLVLPFALSACLDPVATTATDQAIVGGQTATTAEFPTTVALENAPGNWFCTGTLIDKDWVLTAAHCVASETAAGLKIRFDDDDINDTSGGKVVAVSAIHANPGYNEQNWDNDIAVLKLATSVTDRTITPIHRASLAAGTSVIEVGYGDADNNGGGAGLLRKLVTPTVDCAMAHDATISGANVLCFNASDGNASCYGDSGGPAYVQVGGALEVAGVTSGGTGQSCTDGWDLYTSVAGELAFADQYVPAAGPSDPDPMNPTNPDPTDPGMAPAEVGGCATGGAGASWLAIAAAATIIVRRRRR
ncbi:MAG: serine protease [Proteobacteria bacterium]|nr:serine protease [Pseudomonadota bacterium]